MKHKAMLLYELIDLWMAPWLRSVCLLAALHPSLDSVLLDLPQQSMKSGFQALHGCHTVLG